MRFRKLRIACSVCWVLVLVIFLPIWVRSYWFNSGFEAQSERVYILLAVGSGSTQVSALVDRSKTPTKMNWQFFNDRERDLRQRWLPTVWFGPEVGYGVIAPCWIVAVCLSALIVIPWLRWTFSLRTLLIATTLVAVVLGLVAAAT